LVLVAYGPCMLVPECWVDGWLLNPSRPSGQGKGECVHEVASEGSEHFSSSTDHSTGKRL
jgi:hypothetical protein